MIDIDHPTLSIRRQCELVGLNRSTFYWEPAGDSPLNLQLMRLIDEEYTRAPFYGYRKMTARLNNHHGYQVNHKRVERLMQKMGLHCLSAATHVDSRQTAQEISVSAAWLGHQSAEPGLGS